MLIENGISAQCRIEDADSESTLDDEQQQGDPQNRSGQHLDDGCCIDGPQEQWHTEPRHSRRAKPVDRHHEVHAREDRCETENEHGCERWNHATHGRVGIRAVRGIEGPAGIQSAGEQGQHEENRSDDPQVVREQIQPWEGHILGTQHDRQDEVAQRGRDTRNDDQEDHDRPVQGEGLVVLVLLHDGAFRRQQLRSNQKGEHTAHEERAENRDQIHQPDSFVIERQQP